MQKRKKKKKRVGMSEREKSCEEEKKMPQRSYLFFFLVFNSCISLLINSMCNTPYFKSRSGFQNLKKKCERTGQKTSHRRHEGSAIPPKKTTWDEKSCQTKENKQRKTHKNQHSPERLGED
jgi:hypothetical protein